MKSPTQIDVYVVTETITDGLQTPEMAMVRFRFYYHVSFDAFYKLFVIFFCGN